MTNNMASGATEGDVEEWLRLRPKLIGAAFPIVGSWADAEDVVSEAWLRLESQIDQGKNVSNTASWLYTTVLRLSIDTATAASRWRESYIGLWLPEVLVPEADNANSPEDLAMLHENVDLAFIRLLQALSPVDRVTVLLADVFGEPHVEIARIIGSTPAATRQRLSRARTAMCEGSTGQTDLPTIADRKFVDELAEALNNGDFDFLVDKLSDDAVLWTDSDGRTSAARNAILGADKVNRFIRGIIKKYGLPDFFGSIAIGGAVLRADSSDQTRMVSFEVIDGAIVGIQVQQNTEKILYR